MYCPFVTWQDRVQEKLSLLPTWSLLLRWWLTEIKNSLRKYNTFCAIVQAWMATMEAKTKAWVKGSLKKKSDSSSVLKDDFFSGEGFPGIGSGRSRSLEEWKARVSHVIFPASVQTTRPSLLYIWLVLFFLISSYSSLQNHFSLSFLPVCGHQFLQKPWLLHVRSYRSWIPLL